MAIIRNGFLPKFFTSLGGKMFTVGTTYLMLTHLLLDSVQVQKIRNQLRINAMKKITRATHGKNKKYT